MTSDSPKINEFFKNNGFNRELFLDNPLRPVLDEAFSDKVSQKLIGFYR